MLAKFVRIPVWVPLVVGLLACSDDDKPASPPDIFGGGGGGTGGGGPGDAESSSSFCRGYCSSLVDDAPGCEDYNANGRCEAICEFYCASGCKATWEAFAACMRGSQNAKCTLPQGSRLTLVISDCHNEYSAWESCREEKDAGICPY